MPTYRRPTSDNDRLQQLRQSLEAARQAHTLGEVGLSQPTIHKLAGFITRFEQANRAVALAAGDFGMARDQVTQALNALESEVRTLLAAVEWRVRRGQATSALRAYYHEARVRQLPRQTRRQEWLIIAELLLQGDAAAVAAGYTGVHNRAALESALATATTATESFQCAEQTYNLARKARRLLRLEANRLCAGVQSELRHLLREEPRAYRRQVMRTYGLRFRAAAGEEVTEIGTSIGNKVGD